MIDFCLLVKFDFDILGKIFMDLFTILCKNQVQYHFYYILVCNTA